MSLFARPSTRSLLARALLLGVAAGMRSVTPLAALARHRPDAPRAAGWRGWPLLRSRGGRAVLQASWAGEAVVDKLPVVPPRITPGPLAGRIVMGALAGLAIGTEGRGARDLVGALAAGAAGAALGACGGYVYRTSVVGATALPDLPIAIVEDVAAAVIARTAVTG